MKWPIRYTATTPPPRSSGIAPATNIGALTRTSEQAKWSGTGAFGRGLGFAGRLAFQAQQNRQALDDEIEGGIFSQKAQELFNLGDKEAAAYDFTNNMPQLGDEDYYTTIENYSTEIRDKATADNIGGTTKKIEELISNIKSPRVKEKAGIWLSKNIEQKSDVIRHTYAVGHENWQTTQMTKLMEAAAENGNIVEADRIAGKLDEYNLITPQRAEVLKKNNKIIADTSITTQMAQAIMAVKGRQVAIDFVMAQDIDVDIKKDIVSDINFEAAQQQDQLELAREKDRDEISKLIRSGQSATDRIENSYLDEKEQFTWFERERVASERQANRTYVQDKKVYWEMLRKVTKNPDDVTEDDIADKVGYGLTTGDYKELTKIKDDKANPLKTPRAQIYMDLLADLYKDEEITPLEYDQKYTQLTEFMESKPTAQQAAAFWEEQMNPVAAKLADKVFDFYREYYKYISGYKAYEKLRGEPKEGEEDLTNMTDEELEAIIKGE